MAVLDSLESVVVLAIADQLANATIETIMANSDLEVGIEALLRGGRL